MKRRQLILLLSGSVLASLTAVSAQQPERSRRTGVIMLYPENDPQGQLRAKAFQGQLEKAGWTIGRNLRIDFQWGTGDSAWVHAATERALGLSPDGSAGERRCSRTFGAPAYENGSCRLHRLRRSRGRRIGAKSRPSRRQRHWLCRHGAESWRKIARHAQTGRSACHPCSRPAESRQCDAQAYPRFAGDRRC